MSRVVVAESYGGPEVLSVREVAVPEPGPGQVRIAVRSIGVNPADLKSYNGTFGTDPAQLPKPVGSEAAGLVTAVGDGVDTVVVGDEVVVSPARGAYADDLVVDATSVVAKPPDVAWAVAGGVLLTGATAAHALHAADVHAGDTVLVHGAAGGVGLPAVQLAVREGATVIATASPARHALLRELGAIPGAYGPGLVDRVREAAPQGIDAALDLVGTDEAVDTSLDLVADRGRIVTIAAFGRAAGAGIVLIGGGPGADPGTELRAAAREPLLAAVADGSLRAFVTSTYPLAEAAQAHRALAEGHTLGKIVLEP